MIVDSNTTPLNYLVLINAIDVLPKLFERVFIPSDVVRELSHARTPEVVRNWTTSLPAWMTVADPISKLPSTLELDAGEASAISLAKERNILDILIDEYRGRKVASAEGVFPIPTLAVLEMAAERQLLELAPTFESLLQTTYRVRKQLIDAALERDARRKRAR